MTGSQGEAPAPTGEAATVDWAALGARLSRTVNDMNHGTGPSLYGDAFYAEALRRALGASEPDHLPYGRVDRLTGLVTVDEHEHYVRGGAEVARVSLASAEKQHAAARDRAGQTRIDLYRRAADEIRDWCNDRTVPSRFRREGVLLAADMIDPDNPASIPNDYGARIVRTGIGTAHVSFAGSATE